MFCIIQWMIFDFCQCHVGCRQCISKSRWSNAYPDPAPKKWVDPDPEKHIGSMPLVWQDSGMAKWVVGPTYLTLVRASTQLPIVFLHPWLLFISYACSTLNILCLLRNVNSTVRSVTVLTVVLCEDDESSAMCSVSNDAVPAEVNEIQSHMKPVVVLETLNLAR